MKSIKTPRHLLLILLCMFRFSALGQVNSSTNQAGKFIGIPFGTSETEVISILQTKKYVIAERWTDRFYLSQVSYGQKIPSETYLRFNSRGYFIEGP